MDSPTLPSLWPPRHRVPHGCRRVPPGLFEGLQEAPAGVSGREHRRVGTGALAQEGISHRRQKTRMDASYEEAQSRLRMSTLCTDRVRQLSYPLPARIVELASSARGAEDITVSVLRSFAGRSADDALLLSGRARHCPMRRSNRETLLTAIASTR